MTNIVVLNFAGSVGKTTITKQLIAPFLGNAERIQIESINSAAGGADVEINSRQFRFLAEKLAVAKVNYIIDIGGSNIESVLKQMAEIDGIEEDIDWWIVPVDERSKVIDDTLNTISHLINELDVDASRIVVIGNSIEFPKEMPIKLASIFSAARMAGFHFSNTSIIKSDLFDLVKDADKSISDLAADETDLNALIVAEIDENNLAQLGRRVVHRRMARHLARNLKDVWASTPMGAATAIVG